MSTYGLDRLFKPRAVAVVGASARPGALGAAVLQNLRAAGFAGDLHPVNPRQAEIDGLPAAPSLDALARGLDLAVVCTPPQTVPDIVRQAAAQDVGAVIIMTAGLGHGPGSLAEESRHIARAHGVRLVGPNCLGVLSPPARLNASFTARAAEPGHLALVSQSGAIAAGLLEWATPRQIGFSGVVSLGDQVDVDVADCLDHFALDPSTRAILLYVEAIQDATKFLSAARAAARLKPVVVLKSGRHALGAQAAATHTGALAGSDAVYDAAFRRAGLVRVLDVDELFAAAEVLARRPAFGGNRLAVVTNGGGLGVLAVDRLADLDGTLATLDPATISALDAVLPPTWSHGNPVDIIGDADAFRYAAAVEAVLRSPTVDAVLVLNVATALASSHAAAEAVAEVAARHRTEGRAAKPVLAAWVGGEPESAAVFARAGVPAFATEADAVRAFLHLARYHGAQEDLARTPPLPRNARPRDLAPARAAINAALAAGRSWLDPLEAQALLEAYAVPIVPSALATTPEEAVAVARPTLAQGQAVAIKILSPDIQHKSDIGGVVLNLATEEAVREAAIAVLDRAARLRPDARLSGLLVQAIVRRSKAREILVGVADDPTFGPVIAFGAGGIAVEVIDDKALALPPLDWHGAHDLMARTRVSRLLDTYRNVSAADRDGLADVLMAVAQLVTDFPEVRELDLNPVLANAEGVTVVDARVAVASVAAERRPGLVHPRFAVQPYPDGWEDTAALQDGRTVTIRPIRPEDEHLYPAFLARVSDEDLHSRFFSPVRNLGHRFLARLTQIDYAREIAFVALEEATGDMLGVARLHADVNHERGEYAILVRSDMKGFGLGWALMQRVLAWGREQRLHAIEGYVLSHNTTMLRMCRELGFEIRPDPHSSDVRQVVYRVCTRAAAA